MNAPSAPSLSLRSSFKNRAYLRRTLQSQCIDRRIFTEMNADNYEAVVQTLKKPLLDDNEAAELFSVMNWYLLTLDETVKLDARI